jgi:hypothetical protein
LMLGGKERRRRERRETRETAAGWGCRVRGCI